MLISNDIQHYYNFILFYFFLLFSSLNYFLLSFFSFICPFLVMFLYENFLLAGYLLKTCVPLHRSTRILPYYYKYWPTMTIFSPHDNDHTQINQPHLRVWMTVAKSSTTFSFKVMKTLKSMKVYVSHVCT